MKTQQLSGRSFRIVSTEGELACGQIVRHHARNGCLAHAAFFAMSDHQAAKRAAGCELLKMVSSFHNFLKLLDSGERVPRDIRTPIRRRRPAIARPKSIGNEGCPGLM